VTILACPGLAPAHSQREAADSPSRRRALGAWIAETDATDPVAVPPPAADTLLELRDHGES
jgi:hypothetical protein